MKVRLRLLFLLQATELTAQFFPHCKIFHNFAQNFTAKTLYRTGVYGQTFELIELSNDEGCILCLFMTDNKNTNKAGVTFYDSELPSAYYIFSKYITNSKEYSKTVESCKEFFDYSMNLIYLADMKDICDIAPCCELENYSVKQFENGEKYIHIEYDCEDLELLFKIASMYNAKGRAYVLKKYVE